MNALPRTPIASQLQAVLAAAVVTLAMLSGIDSLATADAPAALAAAAATEPRA